MEWEEVGGCSSIAFLVIVSLLFGDRRLKLSSLLVFSALMAQVSLGISNILFGLPLVVAVAHNAVAAILTLTMLTHLYFIMLEPSQNES